MEQEQDNKAKARKKSQQQFSTKYDELKRKSKEVARRQVLFEQNQKMIDEQTAKSDREKLAMDHKRDQLEDSVEGEKKRRQQRALAFGRWLQERREELAQRWKERDRRQALLKAQHQEQEEKPERHMRARRVKARAYRQKVQAEVETKKRRWHEMDQKRQRHSEMEEQAPLSAKGKARKRYEGSQLKTA